MRAALRSGADVPFYGPWSIDFKRLHFGAATFDAGRVDPGTRFLLPPAAGRNRRGGS
jgi:hypothetical protein